MDTYWDMTHGAGQVNGQTYTNYGDYVFALQNRPASNAFNIQFPSLTGLDYVNPIAQGVGTLWNIGSGIYNMIQSQRQFDYQKQLQKQIFEREDSAYQRKVADLKKAGLNPMLAVSGGGSNAGAVVSTRAPELSPLAVPQFNFYQGSQFALDVMKTVAGIDLQKERLALQDDILRAKLGISSSLADLQYLRYYLDLDKFGWKKTIDSLNTLRRYLPY